LKGSDRYDEKNPEIWGPGKEIKTKLQWDKVKWGKIAPHIMNELGGRRSVHQIKIEAVKQGLKRMSLIDVVYLFC
jgi:hypothetical protein